MKVKLILIAQTKSESVNSFLQGKSIGDIFEVESQDSKNNDVKLKEWDDPLPSSLFEFVFNASPKNVSVDDVYRMVNKSKTLGGLPYKYPRGYNTIYDESVHMKVGVPSLSDYDWSKLADVYKSSIKSLSTLNSIDSTTNE